ncbi:MAG: FtsQ-type POTRA domain-containing protein [Actinomycetes bacterium]
MSTGTIERQRPDVVDPRIQARRDQVQNARHRRRLGRLAVVVVAIGLAGVVYAALESPLLDVNTLSFDSSEHVSVEQMTETAGIAIGDQLMGINPESVRNRLRSLPWVDDAHVTVNWRSGTVHLQVTERVPTAAMSDGAGGFDLIDQSGRAIAPAAADAGLPIAIEGLAPVAPGAEIGPGGDAPLAILAALTPSLKSRVQAIVVGADGSIDLKVRPQGVVNLCQPERLPEKLRSLTTLFAQVDDTDLATMNVCVPNSPIVTRLKKP